MVERLLPLLLLCLLWMPGEANAVTVRPLELVGLHENAAMVFYGRCTTAYVEAGDGPFRVRVSEFDVIEPVKGSPSASVRIRQFAGFRSAGPLRVKGPAVAFRPREEYLVFLPAASEIGLASPVGLGQGAFRVWDDAGVKWTSNGRSLAKLLEHFPLHAVSQPVRDRVFQLQQDKSPNVDLESLLDLLHRLTANEEKAR